MMAVTPSDADDPRHHHRRRVRHHHRRLRAWARENYAASRRREEAHNCGSGIAARRRGRGSRCKQVAGRPIAGPGMANDSWNCGPERCRMRRNGPKADDWRNWCAPLPKK